MMVLEGFLFPAFVLDGLLFFERGVSGWASNLISLDLHMVCSMLLSMLAAAEIKVEYS